MTHYTIYKITNLVNNKIYIGLHKTDDLADGYMGSGKYLKRAQNKYGLDNFSKEILFDFDTYEKMRSKEIELVNEEFIARADTYNLAKGGGDGFSYINRMGLNKAFTNSEIQKKNSVKGVAKQKILNNNIEWRQKYSKNMSLSLKGRKPTFKNRIHTEATKKRIGGVTSEAQKGSGNSQFGTMWITNGAQNNKIKKDTSMPDGWYKGRKQKKNNGV